MTLDLCSHLLAVALPGEGVVWGRASREVCGWGSRQFPLVGGRGDWGVGFGVFKLCWVSGSWTGELRREIGQQKG